MINGKHWAVIIIALMLVEHFLVIAPEGRTLHVDVRRGEDSFPGSPPQPFKTISRASGEAEPGDTVLIHPGFYHEQVLRGNSGLPGAPITYAGTDRAGVVMQGSVRVKDWQPDGMTWVKRGLSPLTPVNAFVMVDEKRMLRKATSPESLREGDFHLGDDGTYTIRLWKDADPNRDHDVEVYELDFAFNSGARWGGTAKQYICLRNMTLEKYGVSAISTDAEHPADNSEWELDSLVVRFNNAEGVFHCLDNWFVHNCEFVRNRGHGCQINGAGTRFVQNRCAENMWFGFYPDGGCGLLIGPDASAHSCMVVHNDFEDNGGPKGYGCGVYLEGRSHHNVIAGNMISGGSHSGVGLFGSSHNTVINNVLIRIAPHQNWKMAAAFVVGHSYEGPPTQSVGNFVAHNTIWGCPAPIAADEPALPLNATELNRFVNNFFGRCRFLGSQTSNVTFTAIGTACYECPEGEKHHKTKFSEWLDAIRGTAIHSEMCKQPAGRIILGDPGFCNPDARDFSLKADSPLIGAGIPCTAVTTDHAGKDRPMTRLPAIGAFEYAAP